MQAVQPRVSISEIVVSFRLNFQMNMRVTLLSSNTTKWSNTLKQFVGNSVFDHFVGLAPKGLISANKIQQQRKPKKKLKDQNKTQHDLRFYNFLDSNEFHVT